MTKEEIKTAVKQMESLELTDAERENLGENFITLNSGITRYQIKGKGKNVVLVHGYATPYHIYDKLFDALVASGYRVLRYDLLGRGLSERVKTDYTPDLFARQLDEITTALLGDESFILVGTSMGGSITATYTATHPEKVEKLILLAPAGMDNFKPPLYMKICKVKGIGDLVFYGVAGKMLLTRCASEMYFKRDEIDYYMAEFAKCAKYKGFLRSTLSSLRNTILNTDYVSKKYAEVAKKNVPVLCVWGTADKTMPYYQAERLKKLCPEVKLVTYENSGHIFVYDEGERTAKDVINFIEN